MAPIVWKKVLAEAHARFGIKTFRPGQREILEEVLHGRSTLGLMPTGAGKSLTYQLPAIFLPRPVLVVSPLIALMQDQQEHAADAHITVEKLDSTLTTREEHTAETHIEHGEAHLIYVTPERLENEDFLAMMKQAGGISLLVVDEAHCIAEWGHDFRPAYLNIGYARQALGMPPVLALTATATDEVAAEILDNLGMKDARVINTGVERTNLHFSVHPTVNTSAKLACVTDLLAQQEGCGIIYTASTRSADELYDWLTEHGVSVGHYHGKMHSRDREQVQRAFMQGEYRVMIATKAFGLGVDKPDIRFVVHFEFPDSLETYYQEAGRAGRDGLPSRAMLLYRLEDKRIQSFFLGGRYPKTIELNAVFEAMMVPPPEEGAETLAIDVVSSSKPASQAPARKPPEMSVDAIADKTSVGCKKVQVILHLLREAGIVRRGRRGFVLEAKEPPRGDALDDLLRTYVDRAASDKHRLSGMMHYAQSSECRVQLIRRYFNEPTADLCQQCDNCHSGASSALADESHSARVQTLAAAQQGGIRTNTATQADGERLPGRSSHSFAPTDINESAAAEPDLAKGDAVRHDRFGEGKVKEFHTNMALVHFATGDKKVKLDFLHRL